MGNLLEEELVALMDRGGPANGDAVCITLQRACGAESVVAVGLAEGEATILGAVAPASLTVGTRIPVAVSSRLVALAEGRVWTSVDMHRDPQFVRMLDQMLVALGWCSGAGVPLVVRDAPVGGILLSSRCPGERWEKAVATVNGVTPLLVAALELGPDRGLPLQIFVIHRCPLAAHGLARIIERRLNAQARVAAGPRDPSLVALISSADVLVVDATMVDAVGDRTDGVVVVDDEHLYGTGPVPRGEPTVVSLVRDVAMVSSGRRPSAAGENDGAGSALTARENDLLSELATGRPYRVIASRLCLAEATVRSYSRGLYAKLGVHSRGEAVAVANRTGLVDPDLLRPGVAEVSVVTRVGRSRQRRPSTSTATR